jgi:hypothetical protein
MSHVALHSSTQAFFNRTIFQAFGSKVESYKEARSASQQMRSKHKNCLWACIVYRLPSSEDFYEEIPGLGKKILLLMSRMEATSLSIGVGIWSSGSITNHDRNRMVLDRVMEMIYYLASLETIQEVAVEETVQVQVQEPEPIDSHRYPEFPSRPSPAPPPPFDYRIHSIQSRMKDITFLIDSAEAKSLHELTSHTIIGKVLEIVFCMLNTVPYTPRRAKNFFFKENLVEILKNFDPNSMKKRKIKELKQMLRDYKWIDLNRLESISHSSVLLMEYLALVVEALKDVDMPEAVARTVTNEITEPVAVLQKPLVYHPLPKPKIKEGRFMQVKEMIINEKDQISPVKIAINVRDASLIEFSFANLKRASFSNERGLEKGESFDKEKSFKRIFLNKSQEVILKPSFKNLKGKFSISSFRSKGKLKEDSLKSIDLHKKSQIFSKISLEGSKKTIGISNKSLNDEEIIDKVLNLYNRNESTLLDDHVGSESEILRNLKNNEIERQPMSVLIKFAEILKVRRETHSLL